MLAARKTRRIAALLVAFSAADADNFASPNASQIAATAGTGTSAARVSTPFPPCFRATNTQAAISVRSQTWDWSASAYASAARLRGDRIDVRTHPTAVERPSRAFAKMSVSGERMY